MPVFKNQGVGFSIQGMLWKASPIPSSRVWDMRFGARDFVGKLIPCFRRLADFVVGSGCGTAESAMCTRIWISSFLPLGTCLS